MWPENVRFVESPCPELSTAGALRLGLAQAVSLWPATLSLFLCRAADVLAGAGLGLLPLRALEGSWVALAAGAAGLFAAWCGVQLLRALILGGGLRQAARRLGAQPVPGLLDGMATASPRALRYLLFGSLIELLALAYRWLLLAAAGWLYVEALGQLRFGAAASAALALALTLALVLGGLARLWVEVALVRSVGRDVGYLASLYEAVAALRARPWPHVGALVITALLAWCADLTLSAAVAPLASPLSGSLSLALAGHVAAGVLVAFAAALLDFTRLDAFLALDLDSRGALPAAPAPRPEPPIVLAEPIVSALPVAPDTDPLQ